MNKERAVEEVLEGPFLTCPTCKGVGVQFPHVQVAVHDEITTDYVICKECTGYGKVYRQFYLVAVGVLGLEPAPRTSLDLRRAVTTIAEQAMRHATNNLTDAFKVQPNWRDWWKSTPKT